MGGCGGCGGCGGFGGGDDDDDDDDDDDVDDVDDDVEVLDYNNTTIDISSLKDIIKREISM